MYIYLFLFISMVFSENVLIGYVLDDYKNPIYGVNVEVLDSNLGSSTDYDGYFKIPYLNNVKFKIKVSHITYQNKIVTIDDINKDLIVIMSENSIQIDRVVVTGTKSHRHIKNTPVLTHVIGNDDIKKSSYSNVKDILEMAMPNVQTVTSNHGNDRTKIQGLDNKYMIFLIDGDRISGENAGNIDFSMLGLSNVEKIEVIESAMSTLYGSGAIGGVVNIITKENKEPYWFDMALQYNNPVEISRFINAGFLKGILNYNLNIQQANSPGYDLSPDPEYVYDKTLDESSSQILSHRFIVSLSDKHMLKFNYKDYFTRIYRYDYFTENLVLDAPLNRYDDVYYNLKYNYQISNSKSFEISYIDEKYVKYFYYPYYYSNNQSIFDPEEFVNGVLERNEINAQYNIENSKYKRLIGLVLYNEDYSSYNIYKPDGNILQESIFHNVNSKTNNSNISIYFHEERNLKINNILSIGMRIQNINKNNILLPSLSYLVKGKNDYNYRLSYSAGYREPSIKERYYNWQDHFGGPAIIGNPDLKPTKNNYLSISFDKRTSINDFSIDVYRNDIDNMISTQYEYDIEESVLQLQYKNFKNVLINGINVHYYRKITDKLKLKFVYNLTDATSNSNEILEGISEHSFRINLYYGLLDNLDIVANIKYASEKFIFDQEEAAIGNESVDSLDNYFISDLYTSSSFKKMMFKVGVKNIFDYKDPNRFISNILNNYDPGRRLFAEISISFQGSVDD